MGAAAGHKKYGGRVKGVPNKDTSRLRGFLLYVTDNNRSRFEEELHKLSGKDYVQCYLQLLEYSTPKLARVEYTEDNAAKVQIDFTKYSMEELENLRKLLDK